MTYELENMEFSSAKYIADTGEPSHSVRLSLTNGRFAFIPIDPANRHYDEIMRQVNAGTLTIQDAD